MKGQRDVRVLSFLPMVPVIFLCGCMKTYVVKVNAYADAQAPHCRSFVVLPGNPGVEAGDLEFKEFAGIVARGLEMKGFTPAASPEAADLAVVLTYRISDPQVTTEVTTEPVYDGRGRLIDVWTNTDTVTTYTGYMALAGRDTATRGAGDLWKVTASATGREGDLRVLFRYFVAAVLAYIEGDTGRQLTVRIKADDPRALAIMSQQQRATLPSR